MTKSELFKRMWIPVKKRLPPEDSAKWVLVWNYLWEEPVIQRADHAYYTGVAMLQTEWETTISEDRVYSHWIEVQKP